jgi:hypothetical protein
VACKQEKRSAHRVLLQKPEEKRPPGDLGIDGRLMLQFLLQKQVVRSDWIYSAVSMGKWQALVNAVMNLHVPQNVGNFFTGCETTIL